MKKMLLGFAIALTIASISAFATPQEASSTEQTRYLSTTQVAVQGKHCNGIVGCDCPGFSPITNGDVWQQSYCRHCGHKRSVHK